MLLFLFVSSLLDVSFDSSNNVYVLDDALARVRKFTAAGVEITDSGFPISASPHVFGGMVVSPDGSIFLSDYNNQQIWKFSKMGVLIDQYVDPTYTGAQGLCIKPGSNSDIYAAAMFANRVTHYNIPATIQGDPQIAGFQGQNFQFHGTYQNQSLHLEMPCTNGYDSPMVMGNAVCLMINIFAHLCLAGA